jgi:hypothetical protein
MHSRLQCLFTCINQTESEAYPLNHSSTQTCDAFKLTKTRLQTYPHRKVGGKSISLVSIATLGSITPSVMLSQIQYNGPGKHQFKNRKSSQDVDTTMAMHPDTIVHIDISATIAVISVSQISIRLHKVSLCSQRAKRVSNLLFGEVPRCQVHCWPATTASG